MKLIKFQKRSKPPQIVDDAERLNAAGRNFLLAVSKAIKMDVFIDWLAKKLNQR